MSENTPTTTRTRTDGTMADRRPNPVNSVALGGGVALAVGMSDWLILGCYKTGHFVWVAPSQQLIEMAGPILLLPFGHYIIRLLSALGRIVLNPLEKAAGDQ